MNINVVNGPIASDHRSLKSTNIKNYNIDDIYVPAIISDEKKDLIILRNADYIINEKDVDVKFHGSYGWYNSKSVNIDIFVNTAKMSLDSYYYSTIKTNYTFLGKDSSLENIKIEADTIITDKKGVLNNIECKNIYFVDTEDFNKYVAQIKENALKYADEVAQEICKSLNVQIANLSKLSTDITA